MKKFLTAVLLVFAAGVANAQRKATVSGVVADEESRRALTGAVVGITSATDETQVTRLVTGAGGTFSTGLAQGEYDFDVTLMGYETIRKRFNVDSQRFTVDTLFLRSGIVIDVVVDAVALRTSLSGDTLIYNADSFRVAADSDVSGLLQKMPGIKVENGTVEAQGETVRKVLIDGREFFGNDVNAAITALPAEAVKSIEVFDKLSDNAEFTGIDDGEGYKAINIRTRESMRQGVMGRVSATYGVEPPDKDNDSWNHYGSVSGNVNIFQGDAKITVGGTLNNLNERNYTADDFLGAGGGDGIAKVAVFQTNYIDTWGKKNTWKIDATYRFNRTDAQDHNIIDREYYETSTSNYSNYASDSRNKSLNWNHSFNSRIDFKPNQYQELRIRPSVRYQSNGSDRTTYSSYIPRDIDSDTVNLLNWRLSDNTGWNLGLNVNYRVRLGKPGRTMSVFFNGGYNTNDRTGESYSERQNGDVIQQRIPSYTFGYNLMGGMTYTEPIGKSSLVNLDYSISYNYSDIDRKSYLYDFELKEYLPDYDPAYSGIYNSGYLTHRVGPGYRMQKKETMLSAGVFYQRSTLESTRVLPVANDLTASFDNVTYSVMMTSKFNGNSSLRLFLNSYTRNPSVGDLQDVVDISNVQNISRGNPKLRPSYGNRLNARLILPNVEKGRTFSINASASYTSNTITSLTFRDSPGFVVKDSQGNPVLDSEGNIVKLDAVGRFSEPINMNGEWSARLGMDYGFPLKFMKSNLNLSGSLSYSQSPSQFGQWYDDTQTQTVTDNWSRRLEPRGGFTLGSNISERVDFRIGYNISYNNVRNTFSSQSNSEYLRHTASADFKIVLPLEFTVSGNVVYNNYASLTGQPFDQRYLLAGAAIGKKVFRNKRGEVNLFVSDIFNQNISFRRSAEAQYIQNETNSVIGRYFGLRFTWNIRKFGKNGSQNPAMYENTDGQRRFEGPPGGGPPPGGGVYYRGGGGGGGGFRGGF